MKILVVGATGVLGGKVARRLCERGVAVRALARSPERAADLAALGVEIVPGDLIDAESLRRACAGVDRVFAAAHGMLGRGRYRSEAVDGTGHLALIDAASAAGVGRFVYVSAHGAAADHPVDFFRTKHQVEQALVTSELDVVILRPTAFMEQHVHDFNGARVLKSGKASLVGPSRKPRNFVAADDVAELAVRALLADPAPFRLIEIGGPGHYSNRDVAELYARTAGIAPRSSHLPLPIARALAVLARPLHPGVARILRLLSLPDAAMNERFDGAAALERTHDVKLTTLETFVRERVAASRAGPTRR